MTGLTALRKTVPAVGEALKAGGRLDASCEREARVVQASREAARFPYADRALETFANPDGWNALRRSNVERRYPRAL